MDLTAVRPQAGNYAVLVTNNYGALLSSNALLVVNAPSTNVPVISSFNPIMGNPGAVVNIIGFNFSPTPGNNAVYFGPVQAVVTAASTTNLTVTVPAGAAFSPVTETVGGLTAASLSPFLPVFPGAGVFTNASLGSQSSLGMATSGGLLTVADLDGDGKPEIVTANGGNATVSVLRNLSTPGNLAFAINVVSLPALNTAYSGGTLLVVWPVSPAGFVLQTTPGLAPANWTTVTTSPFQVGGQNLVPVSTTGTNAFYRLLFPGP